MEIKSRIVKAMPQSWKRLLRPIYRLFVSKNSAEFRYWEHILKCENRTLGISHYQKMFLAMAEECDESFLRDKIVADFGCGPQGSLVWAKSPLVKIGIDVLADVYADRFAANIVSHDMIYVKSTEKVIPIPSSYVDIVFSLNALDHVDSFPDMSRELIRIIKPGGELVASFNINEPPSATEPQQLTEETINKELLTHFQIESYRITNPGVGRDPYAPFFNKELSYVEGEPGFLWVRARKPG